MIIDGPVYGWFGVSSRGNGSALRLPCCSSLRGIGMARPTPQNLAPIIGSIPAHRSDGGFDLISISSPFKVCATKLNPEVQTCSRAEAYRLIHLQPRYQVHDPWAV